MVPANADAAQPLRDLAVLDKLCYGVTKSEISDRHFSGFNFREIQNVMMIGEQRIGG